MLTAEQEADIEKNIKKYSKRFEEIDEKIRNEADSNVASEKRATAEKWKKWVESKKAVRDTPIYKQALDELLGDQAKAKLDFVETTVIEEEILSIVEEPL